MTGEDVRRLKELYPDAAVVCYINSTAEVKAESDVCVTSGNVYDIVASLPARRILFVPDRLMAENLRELRRRGVEKEIVSSDGTCLVHEEFTLGQVGAARALSGSQGRRAPRVRAGGGRRGRFCWKHGRDDALREGHGRAVFPHAHRVRPGREARGGGPREEIHRRVPPLPLHEAELAREGARRPGRPAPGTRSSRWTRNCAAAPALHRKDV
jgi:hypothetical protein